MFQLTVYHPCLSCFSLLYHPCLSCFSLLYIIPACHVSAYCISSLPVMFQLTVYHPCLSCFSLLYLIPVCHVLAYIIPVCHVCFIQGQCRIIKCLVVDVEQPCTCAQHAHVAGEGEDDILTAELIQNMATLANDETGQLS